MALRLATPDGYAPPRARDGTLQRVRRLDWRFLLPDAGLERAVYLGPGNDGLLAALRECSPSLASVSPAGDARHAALRDASFDLAVVQSPDPASLARAAALLRRGGRLYCELAPAAWARRASSPTPSRFVALGFRDVERHWHYPDFDRCRSIVPADRASAAAYFLGRSLGRLGTPLVASLAARLLYSPLGRPLLRSVSVVARKGGAP